MSGLPRVLLILACYAMGVVLVFLPWSGRFWERNGLLEQYPDLIPLALNPYVRGAVSGLGVLDILIAVAAFRRRSASRGESQSVAAES